MRLDTANTNVGEVVLNRVRFNRKRRDGTYGYGHFRRADGPPVVAPAPVVTPSVTPSRSARGAPVPNGRRAAAERTDAMRVSEPTVLRSSPPRPPVPRARRGPPRTRVRPATGNAEPGDPGPRRMLVALTVDVEDPDQHRTTGAPTGTAILAALGQPGIRATFFVQGRWLAANPEPPRPRGLEASRREPLLLPRRHPAPHR